MLQCAERTQRHTYQPQISPYKLLRVCLEVCQLRIYGRKSIQSYSSRYARSHY